jgi:hypothetical protein
LVTALADAGHTLFVRFRATSDPLPISLTTILDIDHARSAAPRSRFSTHIKARALADYCNEPSPAPDITIDLSSAETVQRSAGIVLRPLYDGSPKDYALFHALLNRRAPRLALWHSEYPQIFDIGLPALETPSRLAASFEQTVSRLLAGLLRFLTSGPDAMPVAGPAPLAIPAGNSASTLAAAGEFLTTRTLRRMRRMTDTFSGDMQRCHIAWRTVSMGTVIEPSILNLANYQILADDGARTYAKPCLLSRDGYAHLFVIETPESTGIGVVAHTILNGKEPSKPEPVNLPDIGLLQPFVFEHGGETWMLSGQTGDGLILYRCAQFPCEWQRVTQLIDAPAHDAVFFHHDDLLWIATTCEAFQSSASDGLALYWSERIEGPWHAHPRNPVLVDASAARPGGSLWRHDSQLYRPARDCSGGHGTGLTLRTVTNLTRDTFAEETLGAQAFASELHLNGPHTLCRAGGFEVIDLVARPSALRLAFRAGYREPIAL